MQSAPNFWDIGHVFHINIKLQEARDANEEESAFFLKQCK